MTPPLRLRLSREKGFSLQAASMAANELPAVNVARPSRYGNPWSVYGARDAGYTGTEAALHQWCADLYREWLEDQPGSLTQMLKGGSEKRAVIRAGLRSLSGKNLACYCRPDFPCHADVLLTLANTPVCNDPSDALAGGVSA